jgi:hypothetical protein
MAHLHSIYDSDLHFVIDPVTRVITNQSENKNSVIQFDHNSERFTFELPRYIEEHDMLSCNRVEVHYVNIESKSGNQMIGVYDVQDLQVSPHDDKVVICSWLVSNNATQYAGTLNFVLRFACVTGEVDYVWNTAVFKNFSIQNGLYNSEPVAEQYADVLAEWYQSLFTASDDGVTNIGEARVAAITAVDAVADERIADIEKAGSDVIASLPPEYLEMVENMAPPIVETATGSAIAIRDSADRKLRGLTLYGKSTQDGTPTPEAPVEIESVENPTVRVWGKNLCSINSASFEQSKRYQLDTIIPAGSYFFSCVAESNDTDADYCLVGFYQGDSRVISISVERGKRVARQIELTDYVDSVHLYAATMHSEGVGDTAVFSDIIVATSEGDYEPYKKVQTLPVTRTLPGIPVTSGGNYTDENGQQWVCDEVDFGRGVYVQRLGDEIKTITFEQEDSIGRFVSTKVFDYYYKSGINPCLCNIAEWSSTATLDKHCCVGASRFYYKDENKTLDEINVLFSDKPVRVVGILGTPLETALTAEELAAYASLRSNYPNTSVLNDGGAGMTVAYVADTKLYIDKKLSV